MEIDESDLQFYLDRFANRNDVWYQQKPDGSYYCMKPGCFLPAELRQVGLIPYEPMSIDLIAKHFAGTLCVNNVLDTSDAGI